jgi:hypothetical protein
VILQIGRVIRVSTLGEFEGKMMKKACTDMAGVSTMRIGKKESIETDLPARFF